MDDTITIVDYNPEWVILFEKERILLKIIFGDFIDIQHVGSTMLLIKSQLQHWFAGLPVISRLTCLINAAKVVPYNWRATPKSYNQN